MLSAQSDERDSLEVDGIESIAIESEDYFKYKHFATFSASAFINTTPGVQVGYEYLFAKSFSLVGEAGYLFEPTENRRGIRLKGEVRTYFNSSVFLGIEFVYKKTVTRVVDWVDVQTHDQMLSFKGIRNLVYGGPKMGVIIPVIEDNVFFIEIAGTLGYARYKVYNEGLPEGSQLIQNRGFFFDQTFNERDSSFPIASLSIKLKYNFGRES